MLWSYQQISQDQEKWVQDVTVQVWNLVFSQGSPNIQSTLKLDTWLEPFPFSQITCVELSVGWSEIRGQKSCLCSEAVETDSVLETNWILFPRGLVWHNSKARFQPHALPFSCQSSPFSQGLISRRIFTLLSLYSTDPNWGVHTYTCFPCSTVPGISG